MDELQNAAQEQAVKHLVSLVSGMENQAGLIRALSLLRVSDSCP